MTDRPDDDVRGLEALREHPAPRRTDDAFARSVAADVARARAPRWLFVPALAAGAAAIGFVVTQSAHPAQLAGTGDAGPRPPAHLSAQPAVPTPGAPDEEGDVPVALDDVDPGLFTFPALDTSSTQELLAFERRLDEAMKKQPL